MKRSRDQGKEPENSVLLHFPTGSQPPLGFIPLISRRGGLKTGVVSTESGSSQWLAFQPEGKRGSSLEPLLSPIGNETASKEQKIWLKAIRARFGWEEISAALNIPRRTWERWEGALLDKKGEIPFHQAARISLFVWRQVAEIDCTAGKARLEHGIPVSIPRRIGYKAAK